MGLQPKLNVNQSVSTQSPAVTNNVKTVDPDKVSARMRKIVENYPERHRRTILSLLAAMVADVPVAIFEENPIHDMMQVVHLFLTNVIKENEYSKFMIMRDRSNLSRVMNDTVFSIMIPGLPAFNDVDSLFRNPYPVCADTIIRYSSVQSASSFANKLEFADDAKAKLLEIVTTLQSQLSDDFIPQRIYLMLSVVRAVAFINGHKKVTVEDLGIFDSAWYHASRRDDFVSIVDSIVSNFAGVAQQFINKLAKIRTRYSQARSAVANNQSPNYWDNTIPTNWSLDDVVVDCINSTSEVEAELIALTDGKNPANKAHAPLFSALDEAKTMKKTFANAKGIKV